MSMAEDTRNRPDYSSDPYPPKSTREPGGDPLAELARLIGQSDPFAELGRRTPASARKPADNARSDDRPAPEWLARPPSAPEGDESYADEPQPRDDYAGYRADRHDLPAGEDDRGQAPYADEDRYAPQESDQPSDPYERAAPAAVPPPAPRTYAGYNGAQAFDDAYDGRGDDRYRVALPAAEDYEADSYYSDDGHMPPHEEGVVATRRRGGIITIAAVLGLAVVGTAGALGYRAFTSGPGAPSTPPIIKADPTPAKTVPPAPAPAASADNQGKPFQDRVGAQATAERVVPREEQPVALPLPPKVASTQPIAPQPAAQAPAPLVAPSPPANVNAPKPVRTCTIRPDSPYPTASTAAAAPPPAVRSPAPAAKQSAPLAIAPQAERTRTKVANRSVGPVASGAYAVQVSAQRTEAEAQSSYQALQAKYPSVLGGHQANIRRVDLGEKGGVFYRAQVGSFPSAEAANTFCDNLKAVGGQCIVQKN